jgi:hypothetical protein
MNINKKAIIPHGKYKGQLLISVLNIDRKYAEWMVKSGVIAQWGLLKTEEEPKKVFKSSDQLVTADGTVWLGIYEVPITK